jgi:hypothetical protein
VVEGTPALQELGQAGREAPSEPGGQAHSSQSPGPRAEVLLAVVCFPCELSCTS